MEKERLKTTEFWKTWRQEGKDPTKPKFPNKLFHEKRESVRERKYVLHIRQVWIVFYCRFETKLFLSGIPELGNYTVASSANIKRFVKFSTNFVVENVGILEVGLGWRGIAMKG